MVALQKKNAKMRKGMNGLLVFVIISKKSTKRILRRMGLLGFSIIGIGVMVLRLIEINQC